MTNNFPAVPTDLALQRIQYVISTGADLSIQPTSLFYCGAGVASQLNASLSGNGVTFTFATPGQLGTFDQTTIEAALASTVTSELTGIAAAMGVPLATVQAAVTIGRTWTWTDGGGFELIYSDTMTYP